jgi:hypothetical protein
LWVVLALASTIPFFFAEIPPLTDLPNHIARYYIFLNLDHSPFLQNYYLVQWYLIGNLGTDVVVRTIGPILGAELATRVAVGIIPALTIAGIYSVSRALNGQVAPSALIAAPFAYNWPLITGFVNFSLSAAMALLVLAFWIQMRARSFIVRLLIFAPLGFATWVAHVAGWGLLGLGVFGFEVARAYQLRGLSLRSLLGSALATFPFALMILFTLYWRTGTSIAVGVSAADNVFLDKVISLASLFREEYIFWDAASTLIFITLVIAAYYVGGKRVVVGGLVIAALYSLAFILCPTTLFNSGFADRRLLPYAAIFASLSLGIAEHYLTDEKRRRVLSLFAIVAIVFFAARIVITTIIWERSDREFNAHLTLLKNIPRHSRVFSLMVESCKKQWSRVGRPDHLPQLAIVRRDSVINGLFQNSGLNQVEALYRKSDGFNPNMLGTVHSDTCPVPYIRETLQTAIVRFPRDHFDYVWLLSPEPLPPFDMRGLRLIGSSGNDRLYQITAD